MDLGPDAEQAGHRGPKIQQVLAHHVEVERDLTVARSLGLTLAQFDRLSPDERDYWLELDRQERGRCKDCGRPASECADPERKFYPFRVICYPTMEREAARAAYEALHEDEPFHDGTFTSWSKERTQSHPYHANEGVKFGVADVDFAPEDKFATDRYARPTEGA